MWLLFECLKTSHGLKYFSTWLHFIEFSTFRMKAHRMYNVRLTFEALNSVVVSALVESVALLFVFPSTFLPRVLLARAPFVFTIDPCHLSPEVVFDLGPLPALSHLRCFARVCPASHRLPLGHWKLTHLHSWRPALRVAWLLCLPSQPSRRCRAAIGVWHTPWEAAGRRFLTTSWRGLRYQGRMSTTSSSSSCLGWTSPSFSSRFSSFQPEHVWLPLWYFFWFCPLQWKRFRRQDFLSFASCFTYSKHSSASCCCLSSFACLSFNCVCIPHHLTLFLCESCTGSNAGSVHN